jgi:sugar phosphate isomerase/epimerase
MTEAYLKAKENALKIKRSLSNVIWINGEYNFHSFLSLVSNSLYLGAIELSIFNIFEDVNPSEEQLLELKKDIYDEQVEISGIHNIFADIENFKGSIFTDSDLRERVFQRVVKYIEITKLFGVENLSLDYMDFLRLDGLTVEEADSIFLSFLKRVDEVADGIKIHISPADEDTRDYMNKHVHGIELLKKAKFNNIFILVDLKEIFNTLSFDLKYFKDNRDYLQHFHVSNIDGGPITFDEIPMHNKIVNVSYSKDYSNRFFVMKVKNLEEEKKNNLENYTLYIHVFKEIYQVPLELSPFCSRLFPNLVYRHISAEGPDMEHLFNYDNH